MASERLAILLGGSGVPKPHRLIVGRSDYACAVGAELRAPNRVVMASERLANLLGGSDVPKPHRLIDRPSNYACTVGAERGRKDTAVFTERLPDLHPGCCVPDARGIITRCRDDAGPVAAERRPTQTALMTSERLADRLAGRGVPDARCLVPGRGNDAVAVGAERRISHINVMGYDEPLTQIAPSGIELQLRFWDKRAINAGGTIGQGLKREQDRAPGIARLALLAREICQEPRLRDLRIVQIRKRYLLLLDDSFRVADSSFLLLPFGRLALSSFLFFFCAPPVVGGYAVPDEGQIGHLNLAL
jgi:hypothetical protein